MNNIRKIYLLLWKNYIIQTRQPIRTLLEFLLPLTMSIILVALRFQVASVKVPNATRFDIFSLQDCLNASLITKIPWHLFWSPSTSPYNKIMDEVDIFKIMNINNRTPLPDLYIRSFANENEIMNLMSNPNNTNIVIAAIIFDETILNNNDTKLPQHLKIRIRFPGLSRFLDTSSTTLDTQAPNWKTHITFPLYQPFGPRDIYSKFGGQPGYCEEGFLSLQNEIFRASCVVYEKELAGNFHKEELPTMPKIDFQRFPYPPHTKDFLLPALISFISIFVIVSYTYSAVSTIKLVTIEKEMQMKEAMKLMGLSNWMHWTAWTVKEFIQWLIPSAFITALLTYEWQNGCVLKNTNPMVLLTVLVLYSFASIMFCFLISVCFNRANSAATVGGALWFVTYSPYMINQPSYETMSWLNLISWNTISNTNIGYLFQILVMYEGTGVGLQWSNLFVPVTPNDKISAGQCMVMLFIDALIYLLLAIYIETAFPGNYGIPQPWYFPCQATYWFGYEKYVHNSSPKRGIQIRNLTKVYKSGNMAVKHLSLDVYPDQITVLLGHNGAGKSSSMSMLTGMIRPSSGTAIVDGYDIWSEMYKIRDSLGLCPQYNLLFPELTIKEHLEFFGKLKGSFGEELRREIKRYVKRLEMESKLNDRAGNLSGGYKRKLSVAIALAGHSKVVLMDEPTSGMDPTARRCLWDLLQSERNGRTMMMTTHLMDEADLLGDRVAILNNGQLKCVGTPFNLKKKYGYGYTLSLVKTEQSVSGDSVTSFLTSFNQNIQLTSNTDTELKYKLGDSNNVSNLLNALTEKHRDLGIKEYGVSLTTLEDVYIRVTNEIDDITKSNEFNIKNKHDFSDISSKVSNSQVDFPASLRPLQLKQNTCHFAFWRKQFRAMLMKKILISRRTWFLHFMQFITTLIFLVIATIVTAAWRGSADLSDLTFTLKNYRGPIVIQKNNFTNQSHEFLSYLKSEHNNDTNFVEILRSTIEKQAAELIVENHNVNFDEHLLKLYEGRTEVINERYIMAPELISKNGVDAIRIHFNNQPYHSLPTAFAVVQDAIFKLITSVDYSITFSNYPFPYLPVEKITKLEGGSNLGFQVAFNSGFAQSFVCAIFLVLIIKEQGNGAKHLQFISGVTGTAYWGASVFWDFVMYLGPLSMVLFMLYFHQDPAFSDYEQLVQVTQLLLAFNWAIIPIVNIVSYLFEVPSLGFMKTSILCVITGCTMFLITLVMEIRPLKLVKEADAIESIMIWFPHYALCSGLRSVYINHGLKQACEKQTCAYKGDLSWNKPGIGKNLFTLFIVGLFFNIMLLSLESVDYKFKKFKNVFYKYWSHLRKRPGVEHELNSCRSSYEDIDVIQEKHIVEKSSKLEYCVILKDVSKSYHNFTAVKSLSLALGAHECFALLGSNGAGKTTTFKMLTSKTDMTSGSIDICSMDIVRERDKVSQLIGYCPQQDALLDKLTGRETLRMFCTLRGIPKEEHNLVISQLSIRLIFQKFLDVPVGRYSGGNKRKLSTAVAMIGDPPVLLLDEPTSGMDPEARRHLWNTIKAERERGKCIIITTHSLEECEALCTRIAIMVEGEIRCIGSVQHLKNKYASGYKLHVKFPPKSLQNVKWIISASLAGSSVHEEFEGMILFHIPSHIPCSTVFSTMEKAKLDSIIEDYSIQQTSLEQVFTRLTSRLNHEPSTKQNGGTID